MFRFIFIAMLVLLLGGCSFFKGSSSTVIDPATAEVRDSETITITIIPNYRDDGVE